MKNRISLLSILILTSLITLSCNQNELELNTTPEIVNTPIIDDKPINLNIFQNIAKPDSGLTEWGKAVASLPSSKASKKVTLLSFLAFDNNKERERHELKPVINLHEQAGSNELFNQILLTDGSEKGDLKRYFINHDTNNEKITSPYIQAKREKNSGNKSTLASFLRWGFTTYPSKIKILDINSHGFAYDGIALDETSGNQISIPNLAQAIKTGTGKIDILALDACLMSTIEVNYELRGLTEYIVSSEDNTLWTGMRYVKDLPKIISKSNNTLDIANGILARSDRFGRTLEEYIENDKTKVPNVFTVSVVKTNDTDRVSYFLNQISRHILNKANIYRDFVKFVLTKTHQLTVNTLDLDMGQRDLYEILGRMEVEARNSNSTEIKKDSEFMELIKKTREALNRALVTVSIQRQTEPWAGGIAINIDPEQVKKASYKELAFAKNTLWDEMIESIYRE